MINGACIVTLTADEIALAGQVALRRVLYNLERHIAEKHGCASELGGFDFHFAGCLGEEAVAKQFNLHWSPTLGEFHARDVGGRLQVRAATRIDYRLMLHPQDKDEDVFVLAHVVTISLPRVLLRGWLTGVDGKQPTFWADTGNGRPAFFVPHAQLRKMVELVA